MSSTSWVFYARKNLHDPKHTMAINKIACKNQNTHAFLDHLTTKKAFFNALPSKLFNRQASTIFCFRKNPPKASQPPYCPAILYCQNTYYYGFIHNKNPHGIIESDHNTKIIHMGSFQFNKNPHGIINSMENPIRIDIELPKSRKTKGILKLLGLKDNHSKEWVTLFECPALGTSLKGMTGVSRTMETLNPTYERLWPNQDTPQGIYRLEGLMHNHGLTNAPYLNIDNADNPIMLPVECGHHHNNHHDTLDFWHEKILAMALGRYAIRIHGHSLNDQHKLVDGMQTTNGCIQIGDNVHALIDMLVQHNVAPRDMTNHIIQNNGKKLEWNEAMIKCPVVIWDGG